MEWLGMADEGKRLREVTVRFRNLGWRGGGGRRHAAERGERTGMNGVASARREREGMTFEPKIERVRVGRSKDEAAFGN